MEQVIYLSLVTTSIAFTVSESKLFLSLRNWFLQKIPILGKLFSCGYCLGYWLAFGLVIVYRPRLFNSWWPLDYFLTALVIAWLSGIQWAAMCCLMEKGGK